MVFQNIADCDIYTEHSVLTQVARYSPSGFYIASGDQSGKVRIWDTTQSVKGNSNDFNLICLLDAHSEGGIRHNQRSNPGHCLVRGQQTNGGGWRGQGKVKRLEKGLDINNIF